MIKIKVFRDLNKFEVFSNDNDSVQNSLSKSVSVLFGTITQTTSDSIMVWRNPSNREMLDCTILAEEFFKTIKEFEANSTQYETVFV